ncbi:MAG TPA: amidohydrolase [Syntrophobacteraceae bacterium]|nr:amidohydrolase [Syntrophobacteraceae bacterium]
MQQADRSPEKSANRKKADILLLNGVVLTLDPVCTIFEPGGVAILGGKIDSAGFSDKIQSAYQSAETLDISGCVALPGLINAHTHAAMTLFRGLADDLPLMDWLHGHIFPAEAKLSEQWVYWGTMLACAEMILSGTTAFCDMYLFEHKTAEAAKRAGVRALVGEVLYDFDSPAYGTIENGLKHTEMLIERWRGDPLIDVAIEPHALYTCSPDLLRKCHRISAARDVPLVVHLSENEAEVEQILKLYGRRPVAHLEALGLLDDRLVADHCVALDGEDIRMLAQSRAKVVHNPESNMKLASGIAPVVRLLESGVTVALGTDGCASNNNLDMFAEMDSCAKLHKAARLDPTVLSAQTALRMATTAGARALGWEGKTGQIAPGMLADIIVVDFRKPHLTPVYNPLSHLVYAAGAADVRHSIIGGRLVMKDRQLLTVDMEEVAGHAKEFAGGGKGGQKTFTAQTGHRRDMERGSVFPAKRQPGRERLFSDCPAPSRRDMVRDVDWLLFNADWLVACDAAMSRYRCGAVAIQADRIAAVGESGKMLKIFRGRRQADLSGCLLMAGLVNTHTHAAMSLFRGAGDDLPLNEWLSKVIFPFEKSFVNPDSVYLGTLLSAVEMLKSGTTTFCDGYFFEEAAARAALDSGIRAVMGQGILDFPSPDLLEPAKFLSRAEVFLADFPGDSDRVRPSLFCHAPYTCAPETLRRVKELCRKENILFQTHLCETAAEVDEVVKRYGLSPGMHLDSLRVLDELTLCVHAIWVSEAEKKALAASGAPVSHCIESAMKLASGIAPIVDMIGCGVKVGLGTDGCASNNDLDMFSEAGFAARVHKVFRNDPLALPAEQALRLATLGGASALGLEREIGSIEPGKKADLIALDLNQPHLTPIYDPVSHIVYAARGSDVRFVWVDGRQVVEDKRVLTVDEAGVLSEASRMAGRILHFKVSSGA